MCFLGIVECYCPILVQQEKCSVLREVQWLCNVDKLRHNGDSSWQAPRACAISSRPLQPLLTALHKSSLVWRDHTLCTAVKHRLDVLVVSIKVAREMNTSSKYARTCATVGRRAPNPLCVERKQLQGRDQTIT